MHLLISLILSRTTLPPALYAQLHRTFSRFHPIAKLPQPNMANVRFPWQPLRCGINFLLLYATLPHWTASNVNSRLIFLTIQHNWFVQLVQQCTLHFAAFINFLWQFNVQFHCSLKYVYYFLTYLVYIYLFSHLFRILMFNVIWLSFVIGFCISWYFRCIAFLL